MGDFNADMCGWKGGVDSWTSPFEKREFEILKIVGILFVCGVILLWVPRGY